MTVSSARRIRELVVWVGGTLLPGPDAVAAGALRAAGATVEAAQMVAVHRLAAQLTWGEIDPASFWRDLGAVVEPPLPPDILAVRVLTTVAPQPGMAELLHTLTDSLPLRLVSDYPREWLEPAARAQLGGILEPAQVTYTAALNAGDATWCDALLAAGLLTPGASLWVDRSTRRALAALRRGVDAALCEDAGRFGRDLRLWGLLPP